MVGILSGLAEWALKVVPVCFKGRGKSDDPGKGNVMTEVDWSVMRFEDGGRSQGAQAEETGGPETLENTKEQILAFREGVVLPQLISTTETHLRLLVSRTLRE